MPEIKKYGGQYFVSLNAATQTEAVKNKIYRDIVESLLENNVLTIYSEALPDCIRYDWIIKAVPHD